MSGLNQEALDQQAKDFAEAWDEKDATTATEKPAANPNAFYTREEMEAKAQKKDGE